MSGSNPWPSPYDAYRWPSSAHVIGQLSESMAFQREFLGPVTAAANYLAGKGGEPIAIAAALVSAASATLPT